MKTPTINSRILKLEVLKGTATRTSVNAVESRTTSLESDVATAQGDISTLQGDVATLTQGIQDAVSTHNTAPDAHADLRTLIADRALIGHQHPRTDLPWVTDSGAALLTAASASAQRTALGMTAWAVAPWTDGTTSDIPEGTQLYFTNARADARISAQKGQAEGLAPLDAGGKVPTANLPDSIAQADDAAKLGGQLPAYYAQASHTHNYAGSSSAGGAATTALACTGNAATATKLATPRTLTIGSKANTFDGSADKAWTLAEIGAASTTALTTEATTRATSDNALWAALYSEQTGGTECEIPLAATGDGSGVLTLRLWSAVANTATISAGAFYGEIGGTTNLGQSVAMTAGQYTTFYIKLPASAAATLTITYGWALTKWGQSGTECIVEATNSPKLNSFNVKYIPQNVTTIRIYSTLGASIVTGSTRAWTSATYIYFSGSSMTLSGTTYPWTSAAQILFYGNSMTLSGTTYPWTSATQIYFVGNSMTISANLSTSFTTTGNLFLYLSGTSVAVTYPTTRTWPATMRQVYLRPSIGSMPTADTDRMFIDINATCTTASTEKVLDARGNCGAVTSTSSTARASLTNKGFAVSYNS